jgi:hypothetical protein
MEHTEATQKIAAEHAEALENMAAERYLLGEMTADERDAFEAHLFDCPECVIDLHAGEAFVTEAKAQLPGLTAALPAQAPEESARTWQRWSDWFAWLRPAIAAPVFATLLIVVGYQNLVTYPALRAAANQPRLLPWVPLHEATRDGAHLAANADRTHGVALPVDLSPQPGFSPYASYSIDLYDPEGRLAWTGVTAAPGDGEGGDQRISLAIPGAMLRTGTYTVAISGISAQGQRMAIDRYAFDIRLTN